MKCIDGLIWVGQSYWRILCSSQKSCAIPFKTSSRHCYVHEAEWRGCCRKIPSQPKWLIPGYSRIFLAHKDNLHDRKKGRIFGYFHLTRYETITQAAARIPIPPQNERLIKKGEEKHWRGKNWDNTSVITKRYENGRWCYTDESWKELEPKPECTEGSQCTERCDDGSLVVTHVCKDGKWVPTGKKCQEFPPSIDECEEGAFKIEFCDYGIRVSHICVNGKWVPIKSSCPRPLSPNDNIFEIERSCSLRVNPGSFYLVDALAAEITDYFQKELAKTTLAQRFIEAGSHKERIKLLKDGRKLFYQVAMEIKHKRKPVMKIPPKLRNLVDLRGELVLFKYPAIFHRSPRANFRGLMRIDGDHLIDQIAEGISNPVLEDCDYSMKARLAKDLDINKALAQRFLESYRDLIGEELKRQGMFKWPGFGAFIIRHRNATTARNPRTGDKIKVAEKNVVRFRPYQKLKQVAVKCLPPKPKKTKN